MTLLQRLYDCLEKQKNINDFAHFDVNAASMRSKSRMDFQRMNKIPFRNIKAHPVQLFTVFEVSPVFFVECEISFFREK